MTSSLYGGQGSMPSGQMRSNNSTGFYQEKRPSGYRKSSLQTFSPEQLQQFQDLFQHISPDSFLSQLAGGSQEGFEEMEAPALRQFNELLGGLASRFSGMGRGARTSSGFQNASGQLASDFAEKLQSQRQGLQRTALTDLFNMSNQLLGQRPMEQMYQQKRPGTNWAETIGTLGGFLPGAISSAFGGGSVGDAAKGAGNIFKLLSGGA